MFKKIKSIVFSLSGLMAAYALFVTTVSVNSACFVFIHQAKLPNNAKKLRKF